MKSLKEHIVKVSGGYRLVSKKTGKNLGTYPSKAGAEKRERQVQYFKHIKEASYAGNIGVMELVKFHSKATPKQKKEFSDHLINKRNKEAWKMVKNITGIKLHKSVSEEKKVPHPDILPPAGAGNDASDELVHSYTRDTPGQKVKKVKSFKDYTK